MRCDGGPPLFTDLVHATYAYLLGLYLGDGCLLSHPRGVYRLELGLEAAHPGIVEESIAAVSLSMPASKCSARRHPTSRMVVVTSYSKHWPCLFPQHGPGRKHERRIELRAWQREIVDRHPWRFLRGLVHSDGCRVVNSTVHAARTYRYPRYSFSNRSDDIRALFCEYCERVGVEWRRMNRWNISVARRRSVELMDRHVGAKR